MGCNYQLLAVLLYCSPTTASRRLPTSTTFSSTVLAFRLQQAFFHHPATFVSKTTLLQVRATHVNARRDCETKDLRAEMECHIRREIATSQASQTTLRYNGDTRYSSSGFPGRDMAPPPAKVSTLEWKRYPSPAACLDLPSHIASLSASRASTRPRRWCAASTRRGRRRRRT